jgi:hypothetical protein
MRSILFSLTLVFFTGCLTEAATPTDDLDDVGAVAVDPGDPGDPELAPSDEIAPEGDELSAADRAMRGELVQDEATWQYHHNNQQPDHTLPMPDCERIEGKPLDPRCRHRQH